MQFGGIQLCGTIRGVHVQLCGCAIMWYAIRGMEFIHLIIMITKTTNDKTYCLRFANPAEANWRLEAGWLRSYRMRRNYEKPGNRFCMFRKHFETYLCTQIHSKSIQNRAQTIRNRVWDAFVALYTFRRRSGSALGTLGGVPALILGWFGGPEFIPNQ